MLPALSPCCDMNTGMLTVVRSITWPPGAAAPDEADEPQAEAPDEADVEAD